MRHHPHIHLASTSAQLIIYDIFHDMGFFLLSQSQNGIPQSQIAEIIFGKTSDVLFALHIIPNRLLNDESILHIADIFIDSGGINVHFFYAFKRVFQLCRV